MTLRAEGAAERRTAEPVRLTVVPREGAVVAGGRLALLATVRNVGEEAGVYALEVAGLDAGWYTVDPPTVGLAPSAVARVSLSVHPPLGASSAVEDLLATVRVVSAADRAVLAASAVTLTVGPSTCLHTEVMPAEAEGQTGAFQVSLVNGSAAPAACAVLATDLEERLRFRVEPQGTVLLPPGARVAFTVRALPPPRERFDGPRAFEVELRGQDVGALDDTSPFLVRRVRFTYVPSHPGRATRTTPTRRRLPRFGWLPALILLAAVLLLATVLFLVARATGQPAGRHTATPARRQPTPNGAPTPNRVGTAVVPAPGAALSLPVIKQFAVRTDPRTRRPVLVWTVQGAVATTLNDKPVAASETSGYPAAPGKAYDLRATNALGAVASAVVVSDAGRPAAPSRFELRLPSIKSFVVRRRPGRPYELAWTTVYARSVTLNGRPVAHQGTLALRPPLRDATYRLVAGGVLGDATATIQVVVRASAPRTRMYTLP